MWNHLSQRTLHWPCRVPTQATVTVTATAWKTRADSVATIYLVAPPPSAVVGVAITPGLRVPYDWNQSTIRSLRHRLIKHRRDLEVSGAGCSGPSCGTISSSGLYTSPAAVPTPAVVSVTATSVADPGKYPSATVSLVAPQPPPVVVAVTPASASVTIGATQQFAASVTGPSNTAVTWTVSGAGCSGTSCGTISSSGLYTSPATVPAPAVVTVTATSVAQPGKYASAAISLVAPLPPAAVGVAITPGSASVTIGTTQQFAASVTGESNTAVTWTVSGAGCSGPSCGTISSSGTYTSPAAVPAPAIVTVTATSVAEPAKYASATISLVAPQPPPVVAVAVTPASASITIGATQPNLQPLSPAHRTPP